MGDVTRAALVALTASILGGCASGSEDAPGASGDAGSGGAAPAAAGGSSATGSGGASTASGGAGTSGGRSGGGSSAGGESAGGVGAGGNGASSAGGAGSGGAASAPPWEPAGPFTGTGIRVRNLCPFPLWIHAAGGGDALEPDDAQLEPGQTRDYDAPRPFQSARVTAFRDGPRSGEADKVELNLGADGTVWYNITYVDWLELPAEMAGFGGNCDEGDAIGCYVPVADVVSGCPEPFLVEGERCIAARSYCLNGDNQASDYCHALDSAIAACDACPAGTTPEVYACSGAYGGDPRACAALNRGMGSDFDETDETLYYQAPPYNTYAKWVQTVCPGIYGFPYDDVHDKAGLRVCRPDELRITFCPSG